MFKQRKACQGKLLWDLAAATLKVTGMSGKVPGNEPLIWLRQSFIRPGKLVVDFEHVSKQPNIGNVEERRRKTFESPHTSSNWIQTTFFIHMASGGKI